MDLLLVSGESGFDPVEIGRVPNELLVDLAEPEVVFETAEP